MSENMHQLSEKAIGRAVAGANEDQRKIMSDKPQTLDEMILKPAQWNYDDYQKAKKDIRKVIELAKPDLSDIPFPTSWERSIAIKEYEENLLRELGLEGDG